MEFNPSLQQGKLIKRYKRFLTDIELADGSVITIHCPNTGSMKNCLFPGETVWFSTSDNPKRKYPHTFEIMTTPTGDMIGVNTGRANDLAEEGIRSGAITELQGYSNLKREVKYGDENSRIDLFLSDGEQANCYVEVKSCTLLENNCGYFPDAVTSRGQKHLRELILMKQQGYRAVLLFLVQHTGITKVAPADHIDPEYGQLLREAAKKGVEILAYQAKLARHSVDILTSCVIDLK